MIVSLLVTISGCTTTEEKTGSQETSSPTTETSVTSPEGSSESDETVTESPTTSDEAVTTPSDESTVSSDETGSDVSSSTGSETDDEEALSAYISNLIPIVEHHNITRYDLTKAETTFTFAMPPDMNAIEAYCDALSEAKPRVESELADISAITPPSKYAGFHANFTRAIEQYLLHITSYLTYYQSVLDTGTGELSDYIAGDDARMEANRLWTDVIMPEFQTMDIW